MHVRKEQSGSTSTGHTWDRDGQILHLPDDVARSLLAIPDGGFSLVEPGDLPENWDRQLSTDEIADLVAAGGTDSVDAEVAEPGPDSEDGETAVNEPAPERPGEVAEDKPKRGRGKTTGG